MKTVTLVAAAIGMLQVTSAQPHRRRNHIHQHKRDGNVVVTVVDTVYAQATSVPEVIVYVDGNGNPVSTTTEFINVPDASVWSTAHAATPSASASSSSSTSTTSSSSSTSSSAYVAPVVETPAVQVQQVASSSYSAAPVVTTSSAAVEVAATTSAAVEVVPSVTSSSAAATSTSSSSGSSGSSGFGVVYSPYNADGTCKSTSQVKTDFDALSSFTMVRIYGTDCNQVANVLAAAKPKGIKLFAGVFELGSLSDEIATIVSAASGDWSSFHTISIGNELVNGGVASAATVVAAIGTAKTLLKAAGYTGYVVTVDTLVAARANPSLCGASDYCAVNCHPFFDGNYAASDSGKFLTDMIPTLKAVLPDQNQEIVITETGWPWKGQTNGKAVPSLDNQSSAISSIKSAFSSNPAGVILFTAFNDMWKTNTASQFQAEQFWGMGGVDAPSS